MAKFYRTLVTAHETLTNVRFEGASLIQAGFPVRLGGLGIRMSSDIDLPAFTSSLHSAKSLIEVFLQDVQIADDIELTSAVEAWQAMNAGSALEVGVNERRQKSWDVPLTEATAAVLIERADQISIEEMQETRWLNSFSFRERKVFMLGWNLRGHLR